MNNFKGYLIGFVCVISSVTPVFAGTPASVSYVDTQIQSLQNVFQTQLNNLPALTRYTSGPGISISGNVISNVNPGIIYNAGSGITINGSTITNSNPGVNYTAGTGIAIANNVISATGSSTTYTLGQSAQGGTIFYLDPSMQHGLAVSPDWQGSLPWNNGSTTSPVVGSGLQGVYLGQQNQAIILASSMASTASAAQSCANRGGIGGWYLPSITELNIMYSQRSYISDFSGGSYWSSTEETQVTNGTDAFRFNVGTGLINYANKGSSFAVRCIRAF